MITTTQVWSILHTIPDPEIPVITITDLGIVRQVAVDEAGQVIIHITPTYSGCPATEAIAMQIRIALAEQGITAVQLVQVLSPAWTTDWILPAAQEKLQAYGIAPPNKRFAIAADGVPCVRCHSHHTQLLSEFGSTPCKALYQCNDCKEPFDYFKCH